MENKAKSVLKMKPLPVRFDSDVMERCKVVSNDLSQPCQNASEVARNAMEYGLKAMEELLIKGHDGDSHLQEDLLK